MPLFTVISVRGCFRLIEILEYVRETEHEQIRARKKEMQWQEEINVCSFPSVGDLSNKHLMQIETVTNFNSVSTTEREFKVFVLCMSIEYYFWTKFFTHFLENSDVSSLRLFGISLVDVMCSTLLNFSEHYPCTFFSLQQFSSLLFFLCSDRTVKTNQKSLWSK